MPKMLTLEEFCEQYDIEIACEHCEGFGKIVSIRSQSNEKCKYCDGTGTSRFAENQYILVQNKDRNNWRKMTGKDLE